MKKILCIIGILIFFSFPCTVYANEEEMQIIEDINDVEKAGLYYITLYMENPQGTPSISLVKVNVAFEKTVIAQEHQEGIDARDMQIINGSLSQLTKQELIEKASAFAWDLETGKMIPVVNAVVEPKEREHEYRISFSTKKGTTTTINAYESGYIMQNLNTIYRNEVVNTNIKNYELLMMSVSFVFFMPMIMIVVMYYNTNKRFIKTRDLLYGENTYDTKEKKT